MLGEVLFGASPLAVMTEDDAIMGVIVESAGAVGTDDDDDDDDDDDGDGDGGVGEVVILLGTSADSDSLVTLAIGSDSSAGRGTVSSDLGLFFDDGGKVSVSMACSGANKEADEGDAEDENVEASMDNGSEGNDEDGRDGSDDVMRVVDFSEICCC